MRKHHPKNERIKRQYFIWLQEAKRLSPHSIDQIAAAISLFEASTNYKDFARGQAGRHSRRQQHHGRPNRGSRVLAHWLK